MSKPALPPIRKWNARDPIGAVHIIHGLAEHPERYNELATELNVAGFGTADPVGERGAGVHRLLDTLTQAG